MELEDKQARLTFVSRVFCLWLNPFWAKIDRARSSAIISMKILHKKYPALVALLLFGVAAWKAVFLLWDKFPFNSDEAIIGLMARHILAGARPVFFYGQAYMGSLDAWLVAGAFALFGEKVWVIRLVQIFLYLGVTLSSLWIVWRISRNLRSVAVTGLLMAFPTVNVLLYTTVSLGGYNEALLFGNLLLLVGIELFFTQNQTGRVPFWLFFIWGLAAGLGLWSNYLTVVYVIPGGIFIGWILLRDRRTDSQNLAKVLLAAAGVLMGFSPVLVYGLHQGFTRFLPELLQFGFSGGGQNYLVKVAEHLRNLLLFGLPVIAGIRPPWDFQWLILPLIPFVLAAWGLFVWKGFKREEVDAVQMPILWLLGGTAFTLLLAFVFTYFGADPSGRYFLPLYVLAAIGMGLFFAKQREKLFVAAVGLILVFNTFSTLQCALARQPGLTTQFTDASRVDHSYDGELIQFLNEEGEMLGYSNYWVTYPLAFHSMEQILFVPVLPYEMRSGFNAQDDRYPAYSKIVGEADHPAYIVTRQPELEEMLREAFLKQEIFWDEKSIGDYHIFFHLTKTVHPVNLGLDLSRN